ncbi:hypothetical protein RI054_03g19220 [Pseudoscourfieldia marina]
MSSSSTITYTRHDARTLPLNCDVAEFHPTRKERLLVACYELKESKDESVPASREGALHVFDVDDEGCLSECATSAANIVPSGVFDAKWRPNSDSENLLAVALADGTTALYRVDDGSDGIQQVSTSGSEDVDVGTTLFCDWSVTGERLASTSHAGYARLHVSPRRLAERDFGVASSRREAWCLRLQPDGRRALHGCRRRRARLGLEIVGIRQRGCAADGTSRPPHARRWCHARLSKSTRQQCCANRLVRRVHTPLGHQATVETCASLDAPELRLGGGVGAWWHPQNSRVVLCALMYEGFSVAQVDTASATMTLSASTSMAKMRSPTARTGVRMVPWLQRARSTTAYFTSGRRTAFPLLLLENK